jgi:PKD repeat protein
LYDEGFSLVTDAAENVWMGGETNSTTNISSGGFQDIFIGNGLTDLEFLVEFNANGNRLCATYYGNNKADPMGISLDKSGKVYIAATTVTFVNIADNGFQDSIGGGQSGPDNAYLAKFAPCEVVLPVANFEASSSTFCTNTCINYTDRSTNATSWQWEFPGGSPSSSTDQNPQNICYLTPGTYNATLIVYNNGNKDSLLLSNFINVLPAPATPVITQHNDTLYCSTSPSYTFYQWYDNATLIPGATDTFLVVNHSGNYNVGVSNESGCQVSVGINVTVGIQNYVNDNIIYMYPNPATDQLVISGDWKSKSGTLTIFNTLGENIYSREVIDKQETVNCKSFPAGIYFVQVINENSRWVGRFVKE